MKPSPRRKRNQTVTVTAPASSLHHQDHKFRLFPTKSSLMIRLKSFKIYSRSLPCSPRHLWTFCTQMKSSILLLINEVNTANLHKLVSLSPGSIPLISCQLSTQFPHDRFQLSPPLLPSPPPLWPNELQPVDKPATSLPSSLSTS